MEKKVYNQSNTHIEYEWHEGDIEFCHHTLDTGLTSNRYTTENNSSVTTLECSICNCKYYRELARKNGEPL